MTAQPTAATANSTVAEAKEIFARLFVPVDFTISSHRAVGAAIELRRAFGSEICLFNLAEDTGGDEFLGGLGAPVRPADLGVDAEERLRRFVKNIAPDFADAVEVRARPDVRPLEDLRHEARRWGATMVVVAAEFQGGIFRSPAEKLVHNFFIPVLLLPPVTRQIPIEIGHPKVDAH